MIEQIFADNLRRLRNERKLTQEGLAERMGVSLITIQNYENKRRWPDPPMIDKLCEKLNVRPVDLFLAPNERQQPSLSEALTVFTEHVHSYLSTSEMVQPHVPTQSHIPKRLLEILETLEPEELDCFQKALEGNPSDPSSPSKAKVLEKLALAPKRVNRYREK